MTNAYPKIITLRGPKGFYTGIPLAFDETTNNIKLYVTVSDMDGQSGTVSEGTILRMSLSGWTIEPSAPVATTPGIDNVPNGYHVITDDQGKRRLSRMDQTEYDHWKDQSLTVQIGDLIIKPKKDFGEYGFYDAKSRSNLREGWVVVYGTGTYKGCQAMPGAVWSHTVEGAKNMIHAFIAAGGNTDSSAENDKGFADRFHALLSLTRKD